MLSNVKTQKQAEVTKPWL